MLDKEAIRELSQAEAITNAAAAIDSGFGQSGDHGLAALPEEFKLHDLEPFMPNRRRQRGIMTTRSIDNFAEYTKKYGEDGAAVFIDTDSMKATAVLNLGTTAHPGHADHRAILEMKPTAAYQALRAITNGVGISQNSVAEFLEDWATQIVCRHGDEIVTTSKAIAAIRNITIEGLRKVNTTEAQLSASRSTFESVAASSTEQIPTLIEFTCFPYAGGLGPAVFNVRLAILTTNDKPSITMRIAKLEEHQERMGRELANLLKEAMGGDQIPLILGAYSKG